MDPISAMATASAAFGAIKKGFQVGRDIESMASDLSRWMGALSDLLGESLPHVLVHRRLRQTRRHVEAEPRCEPNGAEQPQRIVEQRDLRGEGRGHQSLNECEWMRIHENRRGPV